MVIVVRLVAQRALAIIPTVLVVTFVVFILADKAGGDAAFALAGEGASPERVAEIRAIYGLDQPVPVRYFQWLGQVVQGDLGTSLHSREPISAMLARAIPVTLSLTLLAMLLTAVVSLMLTIVAAARPNGWVSRLVTFITTVGVAVPTFWLGLILILVFALKLGALPSLRYVPISSGVGPWLQHLILPAVALAAIPIAEVTRQLRAAMTETLTKDYIVTAWAMGHRSHTIVGKYALKNAGLVGMTVFGMQLGRLLGGAVVIEQIFVMPGMGYLATNGLITNDPMVVQAVVLVSAVAMMLTNLVVDVSYGYFNPKLRDA